MKPSLIVAIPIGKVDGEFSKPLTKFHAICWNSIARAMA
jgi:hypothetical protein